MKYSHVLRPWAGRVAAVLLTVAGLGVAAGAAAAELHLAAASNFAPVLERLGPRFEALSGHRLVVSYGSSGTLYAQIRNGAPFAVLLSADAERPRRLEEQGLAVPGSRFVYARGRLVLWSPAAVPLDGGGAALGRGGFRHLAIANPRTAPYGAAARQVLERLGHWDAVQDRLVQGENIAQTWQFVASGNAELGFVSRSQLGAEAEGLVWEVPPELYDPIEQQAVLLERGRVNPAATAFLAFLQSAEARDVIRASGYGLP